MLFAVLALNQLHAAFGAYTGFVAPDVRVHYAIVLVLFFGGILVFSRVAATA